MSSLTGCPTGRPRKWPETMRWRSYINFKRNAERKNLQLEVKVLRAWKEFLKPFCGKSRE